MLDFTFMNFHSPLACHKKNMPSTAPELQKRSESDKTYVGLSKKRTKQLQL